MVTIIKFKIILSGVLIFLLFNSCENHERRAQEESSKLEIKEAQIPLIYQMSFVQRYSEKLYLAGKEENWELADIYSHEIEEIAETIISEKHIDDGVDVSNLVEVMLMPQIERIEEAIDLKDLQLFQREYQTLINTCNACHAASNYGAVKVTVPERNNYNQDFGKRE